MRKCWGKLFRRFNNWTKCLPWIILSQRRNTCKISCLISLRWRGPWRRRRRRRKVIMFDSRMEQWFTPKSAIVNVHSNPRISAHYLIIDNNTSNLWRYNYPRTACGIDICILVCVIPKVSSRSCCGRWCNNAVRSCHSEYQGFLDLRWHLMKRGDYFFSHVKTMYWYAEPVYVYSLCSNDMMTPNIRPTTGTTITHDVPPPLTYNYEPAVS